MTFGSWKDYQLQLLWESWDIQEQWQYALSWIVVFLAVVLYHGIHYVIYSVEVRPLYIEYNAAHMCNVGCAEEKTQCAALPFPGWRGRC